LAITAGLCRDVWPRPLAGPPIARSGSTNVRSGRGALAGTGFPIDRDHDRQGARLSTEPTRNSLDTVSDRDFALEFLSLASICAMHLSRLAEEIVIWSTPQFGFIRLSDAFSTGSSIMPQKKNPDAAELVRAKTGRINGLADQPADCDEGSSAGLFQGHAGRQGTGLRCGIEPSAIDGSNDRHGARYGDPVTDRMRKAAGAGYSTATDLADWLVREAGLPFRDAHHVTGRAVALAESRSADLGDLSLEDLQAINPAITDAVFSVLTVDASVRSRKSFGGTAPDGVRTQIAYWRQKL
jgi:argininosuccinate lyase